MKPIKNSKWRAKLHEIIYEADTGVGKTFDVLLEKPGRNDQQWIGRSPWLQSVVVPSHAGSIGDIVRVEIVDAQPNSLIAKGAQKA